MNRPDFQYDVCLSFAGEDRAVASEIASLLVQYSVRVFYDEFETASLWGKDLFQHLSDIYQNKALFCVVLVSKSYSTKAWTRHELRQAQSRAFTQDREYILPVRLDDSAIPGINHTIGYLDHAKHKSEGVAALLLQKLEIDYGNDFAELDQATWTGDFVEYQGTRMVSFWPKRIKLAQELTSALVTKAFERIRYGSEPWLSNGTYKPRPNCRDCGVLVGQVHVTGCDTEVCPSCGEQWISCGCEHRPLTATQAEYWEDGEER